MLGARVGKTYSMVHGRGQSRLREIMAEQYGQFTRVVDATDAAADWHLTDTVRAAQQAVVSAAVAGPTVWRACATVARDGVWVLVTSKDEQAAARSQAAANGVTILGWAVGSSEALAAVR